MKTLCHRLRKVGISAEQQIPIEIRDEDGTPLGFYRPDILISEFLICELKVCAGLTDEHLAQVIGYLKGTRLRHGLLINFGASKLQIKKVVL